MSFASTQFAIFLPIVLVIYFAVPRSTRWFALLVASLYCYAAPAPLFLLYLVGLSLGGWLFGRVLERQAMPRRRQWVLGLELIAVFVPLALFKYFGFLNQELGRLLSVDSAPLVPGLEFVLPVGISFHTFQVAGYLIDVYRRTRPAEHHLGIFVLFVSFFPQLAAGPIERSTHLLREVADMRRPERYKTFDFDAERVTSGFRLILWGFFKKLVIADNLALVVNEVYSAPLEYGGVALLLATYCFAYQIYCDFSGYSDIARGLGRVFGLELMVNFDQPYRATSIREFWQRWHISLTTWFRDYVYVPLGGNRVSGSRWFANVALVFVLSGLWHGANWTFLVWGAIHAVAFLISELPALARGGIGRNVPGWKLPGWAGWFLTFHVVVLAWVFFRASSIGTAWTVLVRIVNDVSLMLYQVATTLVHGTLPSRAQLLVLSGITPEQEQMFFGGGMAIVLAAVLALETADWLRTRRARPTAPRFLPAAVRWVAYYALGALIWIASPLGSNQFIYFRF